MLKAYLVVEPSTRDCQVYQMLLPLEGTRARRTENFQLPRNGIVDGSWREVFLTARGFVEKRSMIAPETSPRHAGSFKLSNSDHRSTSGYFAFQRFSTTSTISSCR